MFFKLAADFVVLLHAAYVAFIVVGQLAILIGILFKRAWVRNAWFRWLHLGAIAIVVAESLLGIVCPLTTLESRLRALGGQTTYEGDFIGHWVHNLLFYDAPPWVFTLVYTAFGTLVLATFLIAPPKNNARPPPGPR
jgi:hypothetical protein